KSADNPCFEYGQPERAPEEQCQKISERMQQTVRCAYRIPITVRERAATGKQLDLGPFRQPVVLTCHLGEPNGGPGAHAANPGEPVTLSSTLLGTVRGEVVLGGDAKDRDAVAFGSIPEGQEKTKDATVMTAIKDMELEVEGETVPDFLAVKLVPNPA